MPSTLPNPTLRRGSDGEPAPEPSTKKAKFDPNNIESNGPITADFLRKCYTISKQKKEREAREEAARVEKEQHEKYTAIAKKAVTDEILPTLKEYACDAKCVCKFVWRDHAYCKKHWRVARFRNYVDKHLKELGLETSVRKYLDLNLDETIDATHINISW